MKAILGKKVGMTQVFDEHGDAIIRGTKQVMEVTDFDVKSSLAGLCFNQNLQLDPEGMFKAKDLADKIRGAQHSVILDNAEMEHIREAYKYLKGLPERFVEFMERIRDAEEISLQEVEKRLGE